MSSAQGTDRFTAIDVLFSREGKVTAGRGLGEKELSMTHFFGPGGGRTLVK